MSMRTLVLLALMLCVACGDDDDAPDDAGSGADAPALFDGGDDVPPAPDAGLDANVPDANGADVVALDALPDTSDAGTPDLVLPPVNGRLDYQLGGDYPPPDGVNVLSRDREGTPAPGLYNICYVNGYQVQPGEVDEWDEDLILRDGGGRPIIDPDWDEAILDISSEDKRVRIAAVVGDWIQDCGEDGFDAIEIDNLDTYSRAEGRISEDDAVAFMVLLSSQAHRLGLPIAQKNSAELLGRRVEMGTDFVVAEECARYNECGDFVNAYGEYVLMIEYRMRDFMQGCADHGDTHAIVLRDVNLVTPDNGRYVYDDC